MVTIFKSVFKSDLTSSSPVKIKMQLLLEKKKKTLEINKFTENECLPNFEQNESH